MFDSIKDALNKQQKQGSGSRDILKFEKGNTYVLRLLPNLVDPEKSKEPLTPLNRIKIISYMEKPEWNLVAKYSLGKKRHTEE